MALAESLFWRIAASGAPLHRASLHVGTLHPQLLGFAWNWHEDDGFIDEILVAREARMADAFQRNPMGRVVDHGETVRVRVADPVEAMRFPLIQDLAKLGITDYLARPIGGGVGGAYYNAATMATRAEGGFSEEDFAALTRIFDLFALLVERHIAAMLTRNVVDTYLGARAGEAVLSGSIERGSGRRIKAVIWMSDLRGFTDLADRLPAEAMTEMLNLYFEALAGAVMAEGGEILKFIGDGLLAIFPVGDDPADAARRSLAAAEAAFAATERLNADPPPTLEGAVPLRSGLALHLGEVFFGNVGAPNRLDFTAIGKAVNEAARVETLTKELGRPLLLTEPVAKLLDRPLDDLGAFALRGVGAEARIFAPRAGTASSGT